jgi:hypothetical protein
MNVEKLDQLEPDTSAYKILCHLAFRGSGSCSNTSSRAGNQTLLQSGHERLFVDDFAARDVDDDGVRSVLAKIPYI